MSYNFIRHKAPLAVFWNHGGARPSLFAIVTVMIMAGLIATFLAHFVQSKAIRHASQQLTQLQGEILAGRHDIVTSTPDIALIAETSFDTFVLITQDGRHFPQIKELQSYLDVKARSLFAAANAEDIVQFMGEDFDDLSAIVGAQWLLTGRLIPERKIACFVILNLTDEQALLTGIFQLITVMTLVVLLVSLAVAYWSFSAIYASVQSLADYLDQQKDVKALQPQAPDIIDPALSRIKFATEAAFHRLNQSHDFQKDLLTMIQHDRRNTNHTFFTEIDTALTAFQQNQLSAYEITDQINDLCEAQADCLDELEDLHEELFHVDGTLERCDLGKVVSQFLEIQHMDGTFAGFSLHINKLDSVAAMIHPALFKAILKNLTDNACKYTKPGGLLSADLYDEERNGGQLAIVELRNGPIIGATFPEGAELGGRWMRSQEAKQSGHEGTGFGLYGVKRRMQSLNGSAEYLLQGEEFIARLIIPISD